MAIAIATAERLAGYQKKGILPSITELSRSKYACLDSRERALSRVESEMSDKEPGSLNNE